MNQLRSAFTLALIAVVLLVALTSRTAAQRIPASAAAAPATLAPQSPPAPSPEVAVLKAQLATMQTFTDSLVATVYWSLGSVVVIASLLVGFGWFTSVRLHERDVQSIRTELTASLTSQLAAIRAEVERLVQDKLTYMSDSSAAAASAVVVKKTGPLQLEVTSLGESIAALQKQVAYTKFQSEAWHWEGIGVKGNEFTQYHELLRLAAKEQDSNMISQALKKLTELLKGGVKTFVPTITAISAILDSLPTEYAIPAAALRDELKVAKTY